MSQASYESTVLCSSAELDTPAHATCDSRRAYHFSPHHNTVSHELMLRFTLLTWYIHVDIHSFPATPSGAPLLCRFTFLLRRYVCHKSRHESERELSAWCYASPCWLACPWFSAKGTPPLPPPCAEPRNRRYVGVLGPFIRQRMQCR